MVDHAPPQFEAAAFNCPLCGAYSRQIWLDVQRHYRTAAVTCGKELRIAQCTRCNKLTFWLDGRLLSSDSGNAPLHNPDQPEEIKQD